MTTVVLSADELDQAAAILGRGGLVAIPTDTVYGIAARLDDESIDALFSAKQRPATVPIAVLCATTTDAMAIATTWPPLAGAYSAAHWPGPLTMVLDADEALVRRLRATRGVGLRVPDDDVCHRLLAMTGPLAVSSANLHGMAPATSADEVLASFHDVLDGVVDAGDRTGVVSTVVDMTGDVPVVVREGAINENELARRSG